MRKSILLSSIATLSLAAVASADLVVTTDAQNNGTNSVPTYTLPANNLLQQAGVTFTSTGNGAGTEGTSGPGVLIDGFEPNPLTRDSGGPFPFSNFLVGGNAGSAFQSITFTLASASRIDSVEVFGGWQDGGRDEQAYTLSYSTDNGATFNTLGSVDFNPAVSNGKPTATMVTFADSANAPLASAVTQLRISFAAVENGYTGYSEISVLGLAGNPVANGIWTGTTSSDWGTSGNWQDNLVPPDGSKETFGNAGARATVDLGSSDRVSSGLTFHSSVSTTIGSTQLKTLILDNGANPITINVDGTHTISSAVQLNSDLNFNFTNGSVFHVSGDITEGSAGRGMIVGGGGTLFLTSTNNSYSGVTTIRGVVNFASIGDFGQNSSLGNRAADFGINGTNPSSIGLLFQGGTLQYTGSTPQSTNRTIRINTPGGDGFAGGATIDASGSNPAATLSFTAASSPDFFESPGTRTLTLTGSNTGDNTFNIAIVDQAANPTTLIKSGSGKWVVTGSSSYSGPTNVTGGTLAASASGSLGATATISVTGGGTLLLTGTDYAPAAAAVSLGDAGPSSGKLAFSSDSTGTAGNGFSQTFSSLTLNANSTIDFGTGSGATFSLIALTLNANPLTVDHWSGVVYAPGAPGEDGSNSDRLLTNTSYTTADLANVNFYNDAGVLLSNGAQEIAFNGPAGTSFEIVPIPEPSTLSAAFLAMGLIGIRERRRFRRLLS